MASPKPKESSENKKKILGKTDGVPHFSEGTKTGLLLIGVFLLGTCAIIIGYASRHSLAQG